MQGLLSAPEELLLLYVSSLFEHKGMYSIPKHTTFGEGVRKIAADRQVLSYTFIAMPAAE